MILRALLVSRKGRPPELRQDNHSFYLPEACCVGAKDLHCRADMFRRRCFRRQAAHVLSAPFSSPCFRPTESSKIGGAKVEGGFLDPHDQELVSPSSVGETWPEIMPDGCLSSLVEVGRVEACD